MSINNFVKRLRNIMRSDAGINGDAQRIEQIVWLLFLKIYDAKEQFWELYSDDYTSVIPNKCRWSNWAVDKKDGQAMTGADLLNFINNILLPTLKGIELTENMELRKAIVKAAFEDTNNYMKDGILLRQVVNIIDEIDFTEYNDKHAFNDIYESILKDLQSAGSSGEFYTPRAVTDFIVQMTKPQIGESIADFACGTGGFLTSALKYLEPQQKSTEDIKTIRNAVFGIEKKPFPYVLCATNMILHDVDDPKIYHDNSLEKNVRDYKEKDKFDLILMNPPYGGSEKDGIKMNFPVSLRSSETADLFMSVIMYRLKNAGRAAVVLPDGFLSGIDSAKIAIKERLFSNFDVHTIIRLPRSVFAPYASIATNILFFDKVGATKQTWFYRLDMPEGYKNFSKTKPMRLEHFQPAIDWWSNREELNIDGFDKSNRYNISEIKELDYDIGLCGFPYIEEEVLEPNELIEKYYGKREELQVKIDDVISKIRTLIGGNTNES